MSGQVFANWYKNEGHRDMCALSGLLVSRALEMESCSPREIEARVKHMISQLGSRYRNTPPCDSRDCLAIGGCNAFEPEVECPNWKGRMEFVIDGKVVIKEQPDKFKTCKHEIIQTQVGSGIYRHCKHCGMCAHQDGRFDYLCGSKYCRCGD